METIEYTGYHSTTDEESSNDILENGYDKSISTEDNLQWLGDGVYFWLDEYYAVEWIVIKHYKEGVILKSNISSNQKKIIDFSSPRGNILYNYFIDKLREKYEDDEGIQNAIEKDDDRLWIYLLQQNNFLDKYDVVIATYKKVIISNHQKRYEYNFIKCEQKQLCVRNLNCITKTEVYNDANKLKELKDMVLYNRRSV